MNVLGVDYGLKRIGLAVSDGTLARPLPTIIVKDKKSALSRLATLINSQEIKKVIFGLPNPDRIGAAEFAHGLKQIVNAEIEMRDETMTSIMAQEKLRLQGKKKTSKLKVDAFSATILLQESLDEEKD